MGASLLALAKYIYYVKLFVHDITTKLQSFPPPPSKHPCLSNKGDYPETLKLAKFSAYLSAIPVTALLSPALTLTLKKLLVYPGLSD